MKSISRNLSSKITYLLEFSSSLSHRLQTNRQDDLSKNDQTKLEVFLIWKSPATLILSLKISNFF